MRCFLVSISLLCAIGMKSRAQCSFPEWDQKALVSEAHRAEDLTKPYTVVIYGGVGCGYSKFLISQLSMLDDCRQQCDVVLIMDQPKDSITKYMPEAAAMYPTFSNQEMHYELKKKEVFPQLLVFKNRQAVKQYVGIKKGMLTDTRKRILNGE